mmetsp:Transcript_33351/g.46547  ORF Transcript_33351/g.46547 Transcript_33351/m.46547 type:complete len:209 (+) Transcript_33351:275-901(+)
MATPGAFLSTGKAFLAARRFQNTTLGSSYPCLENFFFAISYSVVYRSPIPEPLSNCMSVKTKSVLGRASWGSLCSTAVCIMSMNTLSMRVLPPQAILDRFATISSSEASTGTLCHCGCFENVIRRPRKGSDAHMATRIPIAIEASIGSPIIDPLTSQTAMLSLRAPLAFIRDERAFHCASRVSASREPLLVGGRRAPHIEQFVRCPSL